MRKKINNLRQIASRGLYLIMATILSVVALASIVSVKTYATSVSVVRAVDKMGNIQTYPGFPIDSQKIYVSSGNVFIVDTGGEIYGTGNNSCGFFGDPDVVGYDIPRPTKVSGLSGAMDIAVSDRVVAVVKADGSVWTWGCNDMIGRSSVGSYFDSAPTALSGISGAAQVEAGSYHMLVRTSGGEVYVWGNMNPYGALGTGNVTDEPLPIQISGLSDIVDIAAGDFYSLALESDGSVWEWGAEYTGENTGTFFPRNFTPATVSQLSGLQVNAVEASFGAAYAITQSGDVYSWGTDCDGSLGLSSMSSTGCENIDSNVLNPTLSDQLEGVTKLSGGPWLAAAQSSAGLTVIGGSSCEGLTCTFTSSAQRTSSALLTGLNILDFSSGALGKVYYIATVNDVTAPQLGNFNWLGNNPKAVQGESTLSVAVTDDLSGVESGEYFIGATDPGQGNGVQMNWNGTNLTAAFGANLASGTYDVNVRAQDAAGNWSNTASTQLVVVSPPTLGQISWSQNPISTTECTTLTIPVSTNGSSVSWGEFFVGDDDPGQGNGTMVDGLDGTNFIFDLCGDSEFGSSTPKIMVRVQDNVGNWSETVAGYLTINP